MEALHSKQRVEESIKVLDGVTCRKQVVSAKNKSKLLGYCEEPCHHIAVMTNEKRCMCCGNQVIHRQNYTAFQKKFEEIIQDNEGFCQASMRFPTKPENRFYAWIKNGPWWYKIDMRYFIEYMDLAFTDGKDKYDRFFEHIMKTCPRIIV